MSRAIASPVHGQKEITALDGINQPFQVAPLLRSCQKNQKEDGKYNKDGKWKKEDETTPVKDLTKWIVISEQDPEQDLPEERRLDAGVDSITYDP